MELSGDDLAGVVDPFGGLTRGELGESLVELAFKQGQSADPGDFYPQIDAAVDQYQLVEVDGDAVDAAVDSTVLVVGPSAFPTAPEGTADLRHILDIDKRPVDRETAGEAAVDRLREDVDDAIDRGDTARVETLIDVSYDIEAWASVDLSSLREELDEHC